MSKIDQLFQRISDGPIDFELRGEILDHILSRLELKKDDLGNWEKGLFASSLACLATNAASSNQPTSLWLRLCLVSLDKAMIPKEERNDLYTDTSETTNSISYEILVAEAEKIRWIIGT